jgi:hypothetical protein
MENGKHTDDDWPDLGFHVVNVWGDGVRPSRFVRLEVGGDPAGEEPPGGEEITWLI